MTADWAVWARRSVIDSIASLSDYDYQRRVWIRHELPFAGYYDELALPIHILFDDYMVLPDPEPSGDGVLLPGTEITRLGELGAVFGPMIDRLNETAESDDDYLTDSEWSMVVQLAQHCLPAFILAGGWESSQTDARFLSAKRTEGRFPTVDLPATRRRVIKAVAALADLEYQQRTWAVGAAADPVTDSLEACLHTLTKDAGVLPNPNAAVGTVLLAGDEVDRLAALGSAHQLSHNDVDSPRESSHWPAVVNAALHCLPALVLAGAWIGPDRTSRSAAEACEE